MKKEEMLKVVEKLVDVYKLEPDVVIELICEGMVNIDNRVKERAKMGKKSDMTAYGDWDGAEWYASMGYMFDEEV